MFDKIAEFDQLGAEFILSRSGYSFTNPNDRWSCIIKVTQEGASFKVEKIAATAEAAFTLAYESFHKLARRGIDLKQLAAPVLDAKADRNSDISF